jgi:UPF0042 nucleotide-binding protein
MSVEHALVVVVTGLSGAGKSTAVHALEDLGFFCVDNLPTPVVAHTLEACAAGGMRRIALGIDVRVGSFLADATSAIDAIPIRGERDLSVLFLDAGDEVLLRRFSGTRRPHPLSTTLEPGAERAATAVLDGIRIERERLAPLRARATVVIDTTRLSVHDLRRRVVSHFGPGAGKLPRMLTRFVSFGFKYGAPVDADIVLDVRFLQNPYFVDELRDYPGTSDAVRRFVMENPDTVDFLKRAESLLLFCLPRFEAEGKSYLTVGIGCTGGRHRSVVIAEHLAHSLERTCALSIEVIHRDLERVDAEGRRGGPDYFDGANRSEGTA